MIDSVEYEIVSRKKETPTTFTIELKRADGKQASFLAGQFNMVNVFGYGTCALSLSGKMSSHQSVHTVKELGPVTQALARMGVGERLFASGPYGRGWPLTSAGKDILIIAGGVGIAPLRPVLYHLMAERNLYGHITVLYGAKEPEEILYKEEWDSFKKAGIDVIISVDRAEMSWKGHVGVIPSFIKKVHTIGPETLIFLCGPEIMIKFAIHELRKYKIQEENVFLSLERHMDCGKGHCGRCQMGPFILCTKGPILSLKEVEPYLFIKEI